MFVLERFLKSSNDLKDYDVVEIQSAHNTYKPLFSFLYALKQDLLFYFYVNSRISHDYEVNLIGTSEIYPVYDKIVIISSSISIFISIALYNYRTVRVESQVVATIARIPCQELS